MIDFTKPLRVDTPARAGMGAADAAYAAGWCDACIGKQYGTQKPTPEQAALLEMPTTEPCLLLTRRTWSRGEPITVVRCLHPSSRYRLGSRFRADGNPVNG